MAITAQELNVILSARDRQFAKAMKANAKRVERFAKSSEKSLNKTTRSFNKLTTVAKRMLPALAAVGAAFNLKAMIDTTAQLGDLAAMAGESVERFQELAFAAKAYGVEQDKIADILKDVNDKFGDFVETDGGPLKDFFENIAPKVGLTADAFADLSSSEKLGSYISALEQANVSQAEMTFYLEAIASDATLLQRIYANNGAELGRLTTRLREAGGVIDAEVVQKAKEARETLELLSTSINNKAVIGLANLVVALQEVGSKFSQAEADATAFLNRLGNFGRDTPIKPEEFDIFVNNKSAKKEIESLKKALSSYETQLKKIQDDFFAGDFPEGRDFFADEKFLQRKVDATRTMLENLQAELLAAQKEFAEKTNQVFDETAATAANAVNVINDVEDGGFSGLTITAKELVAEMQTMAELNGKSAADQERALIAKQKEKMLEEALNKLRKEGVDLMSAEGQDAASSIRKSLDLWEKYEIAANRVINPIKNIKKELTDLERVSNTLADGFEDVFMSALEGGESMKDAMRSMARTVIKELYRVLVVQQMVNAAMGAFGFSRSPTTGDFVKTPTGNAQGGMVQAGVPTTVGEHGREIFVPQSAGRILSVPQAKAAVGGGGSVVVNQTFAFQANGDESVKKIIASQAPRIADMTKNQILDARRRGGQMQSVFS